MTDESGSMPPNEGREFEDLTLAEMIGDLMRQPFETLRVLSVVTNPARKAKRTRVYRPVAADGLPIETYEVVSDRSNVLRFGLLAAAFFAAMAGNVLLIQPNPGTRLGLLRDVPTEGPFFLWLVAVLLVVAARVFVRQEDEPSEAALRYSLNEASGLRPLWLLAAAPLLMAAFILSAGNSFTLGGVAAWGAGIFATAWGFAPHGINPVRSLRRGWDALRRFWTEQPRVAILLLVIMLVAAYARFNGLDRLPAEMTSDHIEKLLDSQRVSDGARDIFFANNGGREPVQMYLLAAMDKLSSAPLGFSHLKNLAALESLLGIPLLFLLGRVAIGERDRRLGIMLGLAMALFAAVGY